MGTKRIGLARVEALIENLKRELNLSGATLSAAHLSDITRLVGSASSTTAALADPGADLTESLVSLVTSAADTHIVKMFDPSAAGQVAIVMNIDGTNDAVVETSAGVEITTIGEGKGLILLSKGTAATDWVILFKTV